MVRYELADRIGITVFELRLFILKFQFGLWLFHSQVLLTIEYMNVLTGSHERAYNFWTERLLHAIRNRFGELAVDKAEECSIGIQLQPCLVYIIKRLQVGLNEHSSNTFG